MPRLQMLAVAAGTGLAGFLTSFALLHLHMRAMSMRYGLAVVVAYGTFLILIRAWTEYYRTNPARIILLRCMHREGTEPVCRERDFSLLEFLGDVFDFLDLGGIGLIILALVVSVFAVYLLVSAAVLIPEWIAELVLDGVLTAALYHRLRSTVRRTAAPFLFLLVFFVAAGAVCSAYAPEASSIGGVFRHAAAIRRR